MKPYNLLYDRIGLNYSSFRKPDRRIQYRIEKEIARAKSILNVGAGTGSYEPPDKNVIAVEPSQAMINQRADGAAPVVKAAAENLPFGDKQFDWTMAVMTIHHWENLEIGLREMKRTSNHQLLFTWNPDHPGFWMTRDYFPEILEIDKSIFPGLPKIKRALGAIEVIPVPIPFDCSDGFGSAYWRRPEAYLDPKVRSAISTFNKINYVEEGLRQLCNDLQSGKWSRKYGDLLRLTELDLGFCLVVSK